MKFFFTQTNTLTPDTIQHLPASKHTIRHLQQSTISHVLSTTTTLTANSAFKKNSNSSKTKNELWSRIHYISPPSGQSCFCYCYFLSFFYTHALGCIDVIDVVCVCGILLFQNMQKNKKNGNKFEYKYRVVFFV